MTWIESMTAARSARGALALLSLFACAGCAERVPEPLDIPAGPHISWVIAAHREDGDEQIVCQSNSGTACVISVEPLKAATQAIVHLYLHPANDDTTYDGTLSLNFLRGSGATSDNRINAVVKRREPAGLVTVESAFTQIPGVYAMTVSLTATSDTSKRQQEIKETVPVTIK